MKKTVFLVLFGVCLSVFTFAHYEGLGIGIVGGGGGGYYGHANGGYGNVGLSLKLPSIPIHWGVHANLAAVNSSGTGLRITGDYYFLQPNLMQRELTNEDGMYRLRLDWYLGLGALFGFHFGDDSGAFDIAARIPVGLSWHIVRQFELSIGLAPGIGFRIADEDRGGMLGFLNLEIGLRFWIPSGTN